MRKSGKPGLCEYVCLHNRTRFDAVAPYSEAALRSVGSLRADDDSEPATDRHARTDDRHCPDYRQDPKLPYPHCRYNFLEICLLKFPNCPGRCDDYLPHGDQRG